MFEDSLIKHSSTCYWPTCFKTIISTDHFVPHLPLNIVFQLIHYFLNELEEDVLPHRSINIHHDGQ